MPRARCLRERATPTRSRERAACALFTRASVRPLCLQERRARNHSESVPRPLARESVPRARCLREQAYGRSIYKSVGRARCLRDRTTPPPVIESAPRSIPPSRFVAPPHPIMCLMQRRREGSARGGRPDPCVAAPPALLPAQNQIKRGPARIRPAAPRSTAAMAARRRSIRQHYRTRRKARAGSALASRCSHASGGSGWLRLRRCQPGRPVCDRQSGESAPSPLVPHPLWAAGALIDRNADISSATCLYGEALATNVQHAYPCSLSGRYTP